MDPTADWILFYLLNRGLDFGLAFVRIGPFVHIPVGYIYAVLIGELLWVCVSDDPVFSECT